MAIGVLAACIGLLLTAASSTFAQGINLYWNDCSQGGLTNRNFACNSNSGSNAMVASFDPPNGITKLVGSSALIELQTASTPLPSWWQLSASGCRAGSLRLDLSAPASGFCFDYWSSAAMGSFAYLAGADANPSRARITVSFGIPEAMAGAVETGTEYYAFRLIMDNSNSVGPGACTGCLAPACIVLTAMWLYQPAGLANYRICNPHTSNYVTWQGGAIGGIGCPPVDQPWPCDATPALRRSWGLVKGLYR